MAPTSIISSGGRRQGPTRYSSLRCSASLGIEATVDDADVAAYRKEHRLSLEDAARRVRYEFLGRLAAEREAAAIALGHTSDDQAETVLMHLIRGSGLTVWPGCGNKRLAACPGDACCSLDPCSRCRGRRPKPTAAS